MPVGQTGPTGAKKGRPQSFHAPLIGAQGAFACSFYPEYGRNCTPGILSHRSTATVSQEDTLEQARQAFLAIMERQDGKAPKNFAEFLGTTKAESERQREKERQGPITTDELNKMLTRTATARMGSSRQKLRSSNTRRRASMSVAEKAESSEKRAPPRRTSMSIEVADKEGEKRVRAPSPWVRVPSPLSGWSEISRGDSHPPKTAASGKTEYMWVAPDGAATEQARNPHLSVGEPSKLTYPAFIEPWGGSPSYGASYGPGRSNLTNFEASRRRSPLRDGWFGEHPSARLARTNTNSPDTRASSPLPRHQLEHQLPLGLPQAGHEAEHLQVVGDIEVATAGGKTFGQRDDQHAPRRKPGAKKRSGAAHSSHMLSRPATASSPLETLSPVAEDSGGFVRPDMRPMSTGGQRQIQIRVKRPGTGFQRQPRPQTSGGSVSSDQVSRELGFRPSSTSRATRPSTRARTVAMFHVPESQARAVPAHAGQRPPTAGSRFSGAGDGYTGRLSTPKSQTLVIDGGEEFSGGGGEGLADVAEGEHDEGDFAFASVDGAAGAEQDGCELINPVTDMGADASDVLGIMHQDEELECAPAARELDRDDVDGGVCSIVHTERGAPSRSGRCCSSKCALPPSFPPSVPSSHPSFLSISLRFSHHLLPLSPCLSLSTVRFLSHLSVSRAPSRRSFPYAPFQE